VLIFLHFVQAVEDVAQHVEASECIAKNDKGYGRVVFTGME
jgi:hypothetical protein